MTHKTALWLAVIASFSVYLLPVFGVHATVLVGLSLWVALSEGLNLWTALTAGVALGLQLAAAAIFYWCLRRPNWLRVLGLLAAVPVFLVAAHVAYLWMIPVMLLVESDHTPETGELEVVCTVPNAHIASVHSGVNMNMERAAEVWIILSDDRHYGLLSMPDCQVELFKNARAANSFSHVAPGGHILYQQRARESAATKHLYLNGNLERPLELRPPEDVNSWTPVLSDDGLAIAWLIGHTTADGKFERRIQIRDLKTGVERFIKLNQPKGAQLTLISFDSSVGEYVFYRYQNEILAVDELGEQRWGPIRPTGTYSVRHSFRRLDSGWVAWDSYRGDSGRSRIVWALPTGHGEYEVPKGRQISSLSVDPAGRFIGVSSSRSVSVGSIDDAVFVLGTRDGSDVYRRRLPQYSRNQMAFLGSEHLAISRSEDGNYRVDVLRMPGP